MNVYLIAGFAETIRDWFQGLLGAWLSIIPKTIYFLCTLIFSIMDVLQMLVRKLAGLDRVWYTAEDWGSSEAVNGDIVYTFVENIMLGKTPILTNVFWAMIVLGTIILFLSTLIAIFRSEYMATDAKSASKGKIVGLAFKAIASFVIVPVISFFGIFLANAVLQALDQVTSGSGGSGALDSSGTNMQTLFEKSDFDEDNAAAGSSYIHYNLYGFFFPTKATPISGQVFLSAAYRANRIRFDSTFKANISDPNVSAGVFNHLSNDPEKAATLLDECFSNAYKLNVSVQLTDDPFIGAHLFPLGSNDNSYFGNKAPMIKSFNKQDVALVWYYYDLWSFDFLLCVAALVVCTKLLVNLIFGLMKRIFEVIILLLIAPPISAIMPLDNGEALKKWRGKFVGKVIGAYAPIVGLNLLFLILPLITTIKFFNIFIVDAMINLLFTIVGLLMVKDLVATISEIIGSDNAVKAGADMASEVGSTVASVGKIATMPAAMVAKTAKFAYRTTKAIQGKRAANKQEKEDHAAEEGAILDQMTDEKKNEFGELSRWGQKRILKKARLSMTDKQREAAHENKAENLETRDAWDLATKKHGQSSLGLAYHIGGPSDLKDTRDEFMKKSASERFKIAKDKTDELSPYAGRRGVNFASEYRGLEYFGVSGRLMRKKDAAAEKAAKAAGADDYAKEYQEKVKEWEKGGKKGPAPTPPAVPISLPSAPAPEQSKRAKEREAYKNFNAEYFGAEGTRKAAATKDKIEDRKEKEKSIYRVDPEVTKKFKEAGAEFGRGFKDILTNILGSLGGEMAKGFKDAGGWDALKGNLMGKSIKQQAITAEIKNQKKLLAAQDKASELLGRSSGKNEINLSSHSIERLASSIASKIPRSER
jgi:hypothetical protein